MDHLDDSEVAELIEGALPSDQLALAEEHVDRCRSCLKLVASAARALSISHEGALTAEVLPLARDALVGRYVVLEALGAGGMGLVYSAYDAELDRKVALKILRPGTAGALEDLRTRVQREAQALARLNHPNVTAVYEVGTFQGQVFIAMELVEGRTLRDWLGERKRSVAEVLEVWLQAATGLAAAHRAGVVHRDFKPDNVLVGDDGRVRVTDFGVARVQGRYGDVLTHPAGSAPVVVGPLTAPGTVMGTPAYMAPEQIEGEPADARADLFSFCVAVYEALYGERPFGGDTLEELHAQIAEGRVRAASGTARVPAGIRRVLVRGLQHDREKRFGSMDELVRALTSARRVRRRRIALASGVAVVVALGYLAARPRPATSGQVAVAVLPFVNLGGDSESESFSDGMTEELMNILAQLPGVRVAARTSSFSFKGKNPTLSEVGEKLGVTRVIEGSVRREQGRVRIAARLENVVDGSQLWAANYDEAIDDVFTLQGNLARSIAAALHLQTSNAPAPRSPANLEAYELYLRGKFNWAARPRKSGEAVKAYESALAIDPGYPLAWAGLAEAYATLGSWENGSLAPSVAFSKAKEAAQRALEIDPGLAEAHSVLGYVLAHYDRAYEASEREFQTALRLRSDLPGVHHWHSHLLIALGKRDESLRESLRTKELDPLDAVHNIHLAWHYFFAHEPEQALRFSSELAQQDPRQFWFPWFVALAELQLGRPAEAARTLESPAVAGQPFTFLDSQIALSKAALGRFEEVRAIEGKLLATRKQRYVPAYDLALVRLALADRASALTLLRATIDERSAWAIYMAVDPRLQPLAREPAFRELLKLAGLSEVSNSEK